MKIYTGDEGGYLKLTNVTSTSTETNTLLITSSIKKISKIGSKIYILTIEGITIYDIDAESTTQIIAQQNIIGFDYIGDELITCTSSGTVTIGAEIRETKMTVSHFLLSDNQVILGGDILKIFNLKMELQWKSMNLYDELDLVVPFKINHLSIHPDGIMVGNINFIQTYNPPKRRPNKNIKVKSSMKSLVASNDGYIVSDSAGNCYSLDNIGRMIGTFKGHKGCVMQVSRVGDICITISLDRYLRVFQGQIQIHELYLKQKLVCMVVEGSLDDEVAGVESILESDDDDEKIWEDIEKVGESNTTGKRIKIN